MGKSPRPGRTRLGRARHLRPRDRQHVVVRAAVGLCAFIALGSGIAAAAGAFSPAQPAKVAGRSGGSTPATTSSPAGSTGFAAGSTGLAGPAGAGATGTGGSDGRSGGAASGTTPDGGGSEPRTAHVGRMVTTSTASDAQAATTTTPGPGGPAASSPTSTATSPTTAPAPAAVTTTAVPPSEVLVEILNGSGVSGQAASAARALRSAGFLVNGTGNAASYQHATSIVAYPPGEAAEAASLAAHIVGGAQLQLDTSVPAGVVDLVTGASYGGVS